MTSATEVLRRLLNERGVKWSATVGAIGTIWTHWDAFNGQRIHAMDNDDGTVEIFDQWNLTPEQAIAATLGNEGVGRSNDGVAELGAGTCRNISKVMDEHGQARFVCSECDAWIDSRMLWNPEYRDGESPWVSGCKLNYCPNCGAKIVEPTKNDVDADVNDD